MRCLFAAVGLFFALAPVFAQRPSDNIVKPGMERIDQEEGARRLEAFRQQRLEGDYVFEFQLEHKPRRARTVRYNGIMWGSWNDQGAVTRFKIFSPDSRESEPAGLVELITQNGPEPKAWIRDHASKDFKRVEGEALFEPILPGLVYSVFDLQMPFVYWDNFVYEGPSLIGASRIAQDFLMLPPADSESARQDIKGVRVSLDDTYNALWRVEVIGGNERMLSEFSVESLKKVQGQYIVKRITLVDYPSKDRTTFHVVDASVGLRLEEELFDVPERPIIDPPAPSCCGAN